MKLPPALVAPAGDAALRSLLATVRWRREGRHHVQPLLDAGEGLIYVLWHGRLLSLAYNHRKEDIHVPVSLNTDGEYIARVVRRWGLHPIRGSSSRGARSAMRGMLKAVGEGAAVAITPDGPRGPRERMKSGVAQLAAATGAPVVPVAATPSRFWSFGSWDRFLVPRPFSRILIRYGEPVWIPRGASPDEITNATARLERTLRALTDETDRQVAEGGA